MINDEGVETMVRKKERKGFGSEVKLSSKRVVKQIISKIPERVVVVVGQMLSKGSQQLSKREREERRKKKLEWPDKKQRWK